MEAQNEIIGALQTSLDTLITRVNTLTDRVVILERK